MRAVAIAEDRTLASKLVLMVEEAHLRASFADRREEFQEAVELLAAGKVPGHRLITGRAPLEAAQSMFERLEDPATREIKILLTPAPGRSDDRNFVRFWTSSPELKKRTLLAGGPVNELLTPAQDRLTFRPDRNGLSRRGGFVHKNRTGDRLDELPDGPIGERVRAGGV